ncbi:ABC transporter substrate-binding protein [Brooklawnia sp.]|uniref:ABC transporter substrate-binding protein n=1 Tax=Brooklawnia sp. TaxID=2699740 RepID=UPI00311F4956
MHKNIRRIVVATLASATLLSACGSESGSGSSSSGSGSDTVYFGVSGPVTGASAEQGQYWKEGFDLALDEINAAGGIDGKPVALKWEDSQSDPKQSVPIAQKFVADDSIIAELGDFTSGASMAASSTYQQAGLVQFGFTNSNALFTDGGDHMWTTSLTQEYYQKLGADEVTKDHKKLSVVYLQSDWGKTSYDLFKAEAEARGAEIVYESAIQPDSEDYRPVLIKARDAEPDAIVHIGYAADGARVVRQVRELGFTGQFYGGQNTPQFLESAGEAAEGTIINENLLVGNTAPRVTEFYSKFEGVYGHEPSTFSAYAYDALYVLAQAAEIGGATREGVYEGLASGESFDTVQFGEFTFGDDRRPNDVPTVPVIVRDGTYQALYPQA